MAQGTPLTPSRLWQTGLLGFLIFCLLAGTVAGIAGRWWVRRNLPIVTIDDSAMVEGDSLEFTLSLSSASAVPVVVRFDVVGGTAKASSDYVLLPFNTVRFEPGEQWKSIVVETKRDYDESEKDEVVYVRLKSAVGANLRNKQAVGTIFNGPAPAEIAITRFYVDGASLKIDYTVVGEVFSPFKIAVFSSFDRSSFNKQLAIGDGEMTRGHHTLSLSPAFDDEQYDYYLMVMADFGNDVQEVDEENNVFKGFAGGVFVVHEPTSGKKVLHIHGTDGDDSTPNTTAAGVDEVHFRGHGGDDKFDLNSFLPGVPGWMFGGSGNDAITGSTRNDLIFGGAGDDSLSGGDGNDLIVGGEGADKLFGDGGEDRLFGGPGDDQLIDSPETSTFDGGPGRDLFNGSYHNPKLAPVVAALGQHFRDAEDERDWRFDLSHRFRALIQQSPQHSWQLERGGSAIANCWMDGNFLHVQFNTGDLDPSFIRLRIIARESSDPDKLHTDEVSIRFNSIAVTGYKVERKVGPGESDWIEEKDGLWASDTLRWRAEYEPRDVPVHWNVEWVSKPWEYRDHPDVEWKVFLGEAAGLTPIGQPPGGIHAITPRFIFRNSTMTMVTPQDAN
jgi:hypothetical protein